jgi:prepilin-type N-terminal cleavage/methylation domain-containing protein
MKTSPPPSPTAGFTLVEIMVAMLILGLTAVSLAPLMLRASRTAVGTEGMLYENAILSTEIGRLTALPYEALPTGTTCVTVTTRPLPHTRCTTVSTLSTTASRISVVVTPSGNTLIKPDTVTFERTLAPVNPLATP